MARRSIDAVLATHQVSLLAEDGVVGVFSGSLENGTPCIKIAYRDKEPPGELPRELEGYPVVLVHTGEIRPLGGGASADRTQ